MTVLVRGGNQMAADPADLAALDEGSSKEESSVFLMVSTCNEASLL